MYYDKKHTVDFIINGETKNSYEDWQLVPTSRPSILPPEVQDFSVTLEGRQGKIDYYDSIIQYPIYRNRKGSLEFLIDHESPNYYIWHYTYDQIMNFLHGKHGKMILNDQPDYYYDGSFTVDEFKSNSDWSTISIGYDVYPMKKYITDSQEAWLWDPFSFLTGIIRFGKDFTIDIPVSNSSPSGTANYTVSDVRGVSEIGLSFDDNDLGDGNDFRFTITYWTPMDEEVSKTIYPNNGDKGHWFNFILYPGHATFKILVEIKSASVSMDHIRFNIHYREGIL